MMGKVLVTKIRMVTSALSSRHAVVAGVKRLPLYARVDTVVSAQFGLVVLEVELVEPALNLHVAADAIPAVVDAILRAAA